MALLVSIGTIAAVGVGILFLGPSPSNGSFSLSTRWQRLYGRLAEISRDVGLSGISSRLDKMAFRAQQNNLASSVRSGRIAFISFQYPERIDFGQFTDQIFSTAKREGFVVYFMTPVPNPMSPQAYHVYLQKAGEQSVRKIIESPNFKAVPSPFE